MTIHQCARILRTEHDASWQVALAWAHQCQREAKEKHARDIEARQRVFFDNYKRSLVGKRFQGLILENVIAKERELEAFLAQFRSAKPTVERPRIGEGGWEFQRMTPTKKELKEMAA